MLQKLFDHSVGALLQQGKPAYDNGCKYRAPDGCKCAIGHLIPDDRYDPEIERLPAGDEDVLKSVFTSLDVVDDDIVNFLCDLQDCHDDAAEVTIAPEEWIKLFRASAAELAEQYNLNTGVL